MSEPETNGHRSERDLRDLVQENARLRKELSELKYRQSCDREALCKLLVGGGVASDEEIRRMIAEGSPYLEQLKEIEQEMIEAERSYRETMARPVPLEPLMAELDRVLRDSHGR